MLQSRNTSACLRHSRQVVCWNGTSKEPDHKRVYKVRNLNFIFSIKNTKYFMCDGKPLEYFEQRGETRFTLKGPFGCYTMNT